MNKQFKIIAIRPLKGCAPYILKRLEENRFYYLCNGYKISEDGSIEIIEKDILDDNFFQLEDNRPHINISAIVGKNGDGKSSLIELMIRILNNFSYYCKEKQITSHEILFVEGVKAEIYFLVNNNFYCLSDRENEQVRIERIDKNGRTKIDINGSKELSSIFYYTMVSNYSLYAYNTHEFVDEWDMSIKSKHNRDKCWLTKIFHKNDSYQTPVVLHPMRTNGNIDVNTEKYLSNQRLISLFINSSNLEENKDSYRNINSQYAELLLLKDPNYSKLQKRTIQDYFEEVKTISVLDTEINGLNDLIDNVNKIVTNPKPNINNVESYVESIKNDYLPPLNLLLEKTINKNKANFNSILEYLSQYQNNNSDLSQLIKKLEELINVLNKVPVNTSPKKNFTLKITEEAEKIISNILNNNLHLFSILQLQRINLINHVCDLWRGKVDKQIEFTTELFFDLTAKTIVADYKDLSLHEKTCHYIIYKTIEILDKYPNYNDTCFGFNNLALVFQGESMLNEATSSVTNGFNKLIKDVIAEKSHITLKLRQALNFNIRIRNENNNYKKLETETLKKYESSTKEKWLNQSDDNTQNHNYLLSLDVLKKHYNQHIIELDQLPPPIFFSDILLKQKRTEEYTQLSSLSSGEKQMLYSTSAIIYHLQNVNSVKDKSLVHYSSVNLVLEEVELYFHPEYQRRFIKYLINAINNSQLNNEISLNIIFVTHSPFILSDIPKQNVLFLKDGIPSYDMQENTFGANIHSLLKNGFFLETLPIGDFAHAKINELFRKLNSGDFDEQGQEYKDMYKDILLVGEPYLRGQLLALYNSYKNIPTEERSSYYQRKIQELEQRLAQLEKDKTND